MKFQVMNNFVNEGHVAATTTTTTSTITQRRRRRVFMIICALFCINGSNLFAVAEGNSSDALCMPEVAILNNKTNYTELYSGVATTCQKSGNDVNCKADFTAVDSTVATACIQEGGKLYTTNEEFSCKVRASDGTTQKVSVSFLNLGICVGNDCTETYLDSVLKKGASDANTILGQSMNNITESLAAQGITDCSTSFSSGTRVFTLMTAVLAIGSSFVGMLLLMTA